MGDSVARYEDGSLIVETNNLLSEQMHAGSYRMSDQATVVQTYTRVDQADTSSLLEIKTKISDPLHYAEEFEFTNTKIISAAYEFIENDCVPPLRERKNVHPAMNFFHTSVEVGAGTGADSHCSVLASAVGQGDKQWRAYLNANGDQPNARDRIGSGPWYNAKGDVIEIDLDDLYSKEASAWTRDSVFTEKGALINVSGDGLFYCFASE